LDKEGKCSQLINDTGLQAVFHIAQESCNQKRCKKSRQHLGGGNVKMIRKISVPESNNSGKDCSYPVYYVLTARTSH
jgi:hypothetical protein